MSLLLAQSTFWSAPWIWRDSLELYWPILVEGTLVSIALGLIGCFLVVRGMALIGDALSHAVLPGIVIGFLIGGVLHSPWILIGATAMGVAAAVLIQWVQRSSRVKEDASIGIIFTSLFALGVVLISRYASGTDLDPGCVLYGNIESFILYPAGKVLGALLPMAAICAFIVVALVVFYRHLVVTMFDYGLAVNLGMPVRLIHYAFMAVLSLTVVTSFEAVGAILVVALLIMPGATARLWTDRMRVMLVLAAAHAALATVLGYWISHPAALDTSASASISVSGFGLFMLSWLFAPRRGLVPGLVHRRALERRTRVENLMKSVGELCLEREPKEVSLDELARAARMARRQYAAALRHAAARGWLERRGGRITVTTAGEALCSRLIRAHRLWELYLESKVGLQEDHLHDPAEWIEHYLDEKRLQQLEQLLNVPADYLRRPHQPPA